ncbi:hypothetical protein TX25_08335 [Pseudomonas lactis]|nr:hypothetical protein TX25_08335 [Pseudomonas lactis]
MPARKARGAIVEKGEKRRKAIGDYLNNPKHHKHKCRSELAREKLTDTALIQEARVIVDVFREQARSYIRIGASPTW